MQKEIKRVFVIACLQAFCMSGCTPTAQLSKIEISHILKQSPETWTIKQCDSIIKRFTTSNIKDYDANNPYQYIADNKVYIKATPFNRDVICATVRKEAIQKRFSVERFRQRLKTDLESFTNFTVDLQTGKIFDKQNRDDILHEYTFLVYFENISDPHRTIEVFKAEEGFFLEHENGHFTRVNAISGNEIGNYFVLYGDMNTMITFSAFTDDNKRLQFDEKNIGQYRLVFNGLQEKSIVLDWKHL